MVTKIGIASERSRIMAYIIDNLAISMMLAFVITISVSVLSFTLVSTGTPPIYLFFILPVLILPLIYVLFKDSIRKGRSFGKKFNKIKVIDYKTLKPCTAIQSFLRNIILFIPMMIIVEYIILHMDDEGRRLGDKFAGTIVVRE